MTQLEANMTLESPDATSPAAAPYVPRWSLLFIRILAYALFEYARLLQMFAILQGLQVGKIMVAMSALGPLMCPRSGLQLSAIAEPPWEEGRTAQVDVNSRNFGLFRCSEVKSQRRKDNAQPQGTLGEH